MQSDGWPFLTPETIEQFIEQPEKLDYEDSDFVEGFFKCYSDFWEDQHRRSSKSTSR